MLVSLSCLRTATGAFTKDLLRHYSRLHQLLLLGYGLMSNHVHLVVIPERLDSLALLKNAHGRYATHWNVGHNSSGHVWQGRYYSCPLDESHLCGRRSGMWSLNPVRAGLVKDAPKYPWPSAAAHCGTAPAEEWLDMEWWREHWNSASWRDSLASGGTEGEAEAIRESTHTGRPLGRPEFVERLEKTLRRRLGAPKRRSAAERGEGRKAGGPHL